MWLLAAVIEIVRAPIVAVGVLLAATLVTTVLWLRDLAAELDLHPVVTPGLGLALLVTSPLLASTIGLESYLVVCLIVGLARYLASHRWGAAGFVADLLILARPDVGAAFALAAAAVWPWRAVRPWRSLALAAGTCAATVLPWLALSWWRLGSAIPDTLVAKIDGNWIPDPHQLGADQ